MERTASCHCGKLVLTCTGDPAKVSLCHCFDCQRRTGSLFSVAAFFSRDCVELPAGAKAFKRPSASGRDVSFHFCPDCVRCEARGRRRPDIVWGPEENTSELQSLMRNHY